MLQIKRNLNKQINIDLNTTVKYLIMAIATILFFVFGQGVTWYAIGGDTEAYYLEFAHHIETKPLYSLFVHSMDFCFGKTGYLYAVAVIQIIIAVICIVVFVRYLADKLHLGVVSTILIWGATLLPFYILLPEDPIPHTIMTESLTYPLMYLFIMYVLKALWEQEHIYRYWVIAILLSVVATLIRGQMLFMLAVVLCAYFYYVIRESLLLKKKDLKGTLISLAIFCLTLFIAYEIQIGITLGYEKYFFDAGRLDYSAQTLVQKALFCSDEEDVELFEDEDTRIIYETTYRCMMDEGTNYRFIQGELTDWKMITASFGMNSRLVGDAIEDLLREENRWPEEVVEQEKLVLGYCREITDAIMKAHPERILRVSISMMPAGFVSSVLVHKESIYLLIYICTFMVYLFALVLSGIVYSREKGVAEYIWLIVGTAVVNVTSSNIVHFGLQRYLAYTLGLFYVGIILGFRVLITRYRKNDKIKC